MALPESGVSLVAKGEAAFNRAMDIATSKIRQQGDAAIKTSSQSTKGNDALGKAIGNLQQKYLQLVPGGQASIDMLTKFAGSLGISTAATLGAVAAVAALAVGLLALGQRGSALTGLAESFDRLTASIGLSSQALLIDLRKAAAGTVSDFDLIRRTNLALAGATGKFGQAFGQNLPKILEIARAQARATGQDVDFLFSSLVTGIKRASPLLIDNTGIVLKISAANEALAESLGKSVEALTAEEKQIAVLNAVLESGQKAIDALGSSNETAAEKIARAQSTVTNILDRLGLAVQPGFELILDGVNRILGVIEQLAGAIGVFLSPIVELFGATFNTVVNIVLSIIEPIVDAVLSFVPYLGIAFEGIVSLLTGVQNIISGAVSGIVDIIRWLLQNILGIADFDQLGPALFNGAAAVFGSFANGIITVANQLIFPAIIGIAQFIADFLIGFSPPKKGPLSKIDEGGRNLMTSWMEGIAGVALDPVEKVAQEVSDALGGIGQKSLPQVNKRLGQLDKALLPFQNRLSIVKATFDAISEPAKLALDAIDRQMGTALEALARGEAGSDETVRKLDAQRAAIQASLDAQQGLTDAAQIQLGLATAQQARERALLMIRKAQLELAEKAKQKAGVKKKTGSTTVPGTPDTPQAPSGGTAPDLPVPIGGGLPGGGNTDDQSVLDLLTGGVDAAKAGIQDAFAGEIDLEQLGLFQENSGALQKQLSRFADVDIGKALTDKLGNIGPAIETALGEAGTVILAKLTDIADSITNPEREGSVPYFLQVTLPANIETARASIDTALRSVFNLLDPAVEGSPVNEAKKFVETLFGESTEEGSIAFFFASLPEKITTGLATLGETLNTFFGLDDPETPLGKLKADITLLMGDSSTEGSIAYLFAALPGNVTEALETLYDDVVESFVSVKDFLIGTGPGSIADYINQAVQWFASLPGGILSALQGFAASVYSSIAAPIVTVFNSLADIIQDVVRNIAKGIVDFLQPTIDSLAGSIFGVPPFLQDLLNKLNDVQGGFTVPHLSGDLPAFLTGAAKGGLFTGGALRVGERGEEIISSASKTAVFPNEFVQALDRLTSVLVAQPVAMPSGGSTYNDNHSISATFNGVEGPGDVMRRFARMKARR